MGKLMRIVKRVDEQGRKVFCEVMNEGPVSFDARPRWLLLAYPPGAPIKSQKVQWVHHADPSIAWDREIDFTAPDAIPDHDLAESTVRLVLIGPMIDLRFKYEAVRYMRSRNAMREVLKEIAAFVKDNARYAPFPLLESELTLQTLVAKVLAAMSLSDNGTAPAGSQEQNIEQQDLARKIDVLSQRAIENYLLHSPWHDWFPRHELDWDWKWQDMPGWRDTFGG